MTAPSASSSTPIERGDAAAQRARLSAADILPRDVDQARLVGRVWSKKMGGPCPVFLRQGQLYDVSSVACTLSALLDRSDLLTQFDQNWDLPVLGSVQDFLDGSAGELLAPLDLHLESPTGDRARDRGAVI